MPKLSTLVLLSGILVALLLCAWTMGAGRAEQRGFERRHRETLCEQACEERGGLLYVSPEGTGGRYCVCEDGHSVPAV